MSKTINRYIPEKIYEHLKKSSFKNKEHLIIICDMINRISIFRKEDKDYSNIFTDIPGNYFKDIISNEISYKNAMDYLLDNKLIDCDGLYSKALGKAFGYKINDEYFSKLIKVQVCKPTLTKKIISNINTKNSYVNEKYKKYKSFFLSNFDIDYEEGLNYINTNLNTSLCTTNSIKDRFKLINKYNHSFMALSAINDGDLFFRYNKTNGRIDTNLTNLKSELKVFIKTKNLVQVDIVNSQPYFLNLILSSNPSLCTTNSEFEKYNNWTTKGIFYENFQREYYKNTGKSMNRKEIKNLMFCIYYSRNNSYIKEKNIFRSIFPEIMKWIEKEKENRHNELAIKMQKIESNFCINIVCQELDKHNINYYTIHDAWLVDRFDELRVKNIIEQCFINTYNNIPKLKIEKIN